MTQEDKQLLLKDLCMRLPYGVNIQIKECLALDTELKIEYINRLQNGEIELKPYLRPMWSMTKEETEIINKLVYNTEDDFLSPIAVWVINESDVDKYIDFCLSHHLDYRGLIDKELALEAPKDMYEIE